MIPSDEECMSDDVVADLERLCKVEHSSLVVAVYRRAINEIKTLRAMAATAGAASLGPSFAEITKDLPRRSGESD